MRSKRMIAIVFFSLLISGSTSISFIEKDKYNSTLQVFTKTGKVQGKEVNSDSGISYFAYLGIPYAAPPMKSLRFRSPQPIGRWQGVLNATQPQSGCVELQFRTTGDILIVLGEEDCLYINVFTPIRRESTEKRNLPVFFYIYGGAFMEGSSASLQPDFIIEQDLIVVTFNYRAGIFGFLSTEDEASYGNYGLKDQHVALKWTNMNIKKFGGDPNKITVVGHSSGGYSAMYQMLYRKSWGLFSAAVAMSGGVSSPFGLQKYSRRLAFDVGLNLGIETNNSTELIDKLRQTDPHKLKQAERVATLASVPTLLENGLPFTPVVEPVHGEAFLTKHPVDMLKNGEFFRIPLIMGMTTNEVVTLGAVVPLLRPFMLLYDWSPGLFPNQFRELESVPKRREVGQKLRRKYTKSDSFFSASNEEIIRMLSDLLYVRPLTNAAKIFSEYIPIYFYLYSYISEDAKNHMLHDGMPTDTSLSGVGHVEELIYLWKYNDVKLAPGADPMRYQLPKIFANFLKFRNPTPIKDPLFHNVTWPMLSNTKNSTYFNMDKKFSLYQNYRTEFVDFLNELSDPIND
ncbi:hypothetical protein JTB14_021689 [Gonioctena quinquepunctata]|nr:hypothetical protein JTB14_021689 [Gonioctena quinquepunctata]